VLNELRAAREMGLQTFALWRWERRRLTLEHLGQAHQPRFAPGPWRCSTRPRRGYEGDGDILRITGRPAASVQSPWTPTSSIRARSSSTMRWTCIPTYTIEQYGYHPNQ